jgi:hypothetical protein
VGSLDDYTSSEVLVWHSSDFRHLPIYVRRPGKRTLTSHNKGYAIICVIFVLQGVLSAALPRMKLRCRSQAISVAAKNGVTG